MVFEKDLHESAAGILDLRWIRAGAPPRRRELGVRGDLRDRHDLEPCNVVLVILEGHDPGGELTTTRSVLDGHPSSLRET
ncbi:MAG: hypothetical protein QM820_36240 [Minicystis sp.]